MVLQTDFILLPCDFVPPSSLALADLLDAHRSRPNATVTSLFYERAELGKDGPERILVGYEPGPPTTTSALPATLTASASTSEGARPRRKGDRGGTLLFVRELEDTEDDVVVRLSMLRKYVLHSLQPFVLETVRIALRLGACYFSASATIAARSLAVSRRLDEPGARRLILQALDASIPVMNAFSSLYFDIGAVGRCSHLWESAAASPGDEDIHLWQHPPASLGVCSEGLSLLLLPALVSGSPSKSS